MSRDRSQISTAPPGRNLAPAWSEVGPEEEKDESEEVPEQEPASQAAIELAAGEAGFHVSNDLRKSALGREGSADHDVATGVGGGRCGSVPSGPALPSDSVVESIARRVVELLREEVPSGPHLVDAAVVAERHGVARSWVYENAERLGAVRLGDGPRARLRFDLREVDRRLASWSAAGGQKGQRPARTSELRGNRLAGQWAPTLSCCPYEGCRTAISRCAAERKQQGGTHDQQGQPHDGAC